MGDTSIEWTDKTWNPVTGCSKVSEGCRFCYAKTLHDMRHKAHKAGKKIAPTYHTPFETVVCRPERLSLPLKWRTPSRIFVNSMSDLFHEDVPDAFIDQVFAVMALCPQHSFQVLTKRAERMQAYCNDQSLARRDGRGTAVLKLQSERNAVPLESLTWPLPNVWLGVSVEDQGSADARVPWLLKTPAAVRFLSCEPLLGAITLGFGFQVSSCELTAVNPKLATRNSQRAVDWVIVGGESGRGARPLHPDWARGLRDQCQGAGVAFFFKQWGCYELGNGHDCVFIDPRGNYSGPGPFVAMQPVGKSRSGRVLDGREWNEWPAGRG